MKLDRFGCMIFDLDGTLIDSADVWKNIDIKFLKKRGIEIPDDYAKSVSVMNFSDAAEYTKKRFSLDESPDELINEWFEMAVYEYSHNIKAKPHAAEFLGRIKQLGIKTALATASNKALYTAVLKNNGLLGFIDAFASTEEVRRGKGFPDVYLFAAEKLGSMPHECLVFEDIIEGIRGAKAGGFAAAAVVNGIFPEDDALMRREADLSFSDYSELIAML